MNVRKIVDQYLLENGFDGLFSDFGDCACVNDDLMPCSDSTVPECKPGHRMPCDCGEHDFHIAEALNPKQSD